MTENTPTPETMMTAQLAALDQTFHDFLARSRRDGLYDPETDVKIALRAQALFRVTLSALDKINHPPGDDSE